jgi:hypothetical protein
LEPLWDRRRNEEGRDAAWYAGMRARVEAKATLEQVEELRRGLEGLKERFG